MRNIHTKTGRIPNIRRLLPFSLVVVAVFHRPALADVNVEDLQFPPGDQWELREPAAPPEPFSRGVGHFGLWGQGVVLNGTRFSLGSTEIEAVDGASLGGIEAGGGFGGFTFGAGYRPKRWLRLPEVRLSLGMGPVRGDWRRLDNGLEVRPERLLVARAEVLIGVEYDFEHFSPFLRVYGSYGLATLRVEVRDAQLGRLGSEGARRGMGDIGAEAGITWNLNEHFGIAFAYRYSVFGAATHGAMLALSVRGKKRS